MPNKMLIDASHPEETRVVVVRGNRIEEFDFESQDKKQLRGNIYLARVTRVEPSLQAAFVEYGGNRHGFLAFNEIHPDYYQIPVADRQALLRAEAAQARQEDDDDDDETAEGQDGEQRHDRGRRNKRRGRGRDRHAHQSDEGSNAEISADSADGATDNASDASVEPGDVTVEPFEAATHAETASADTADGNGAVPAAEAPADEFASDDTAEASEADEGGSSPKSIAAEVDGDVVSEAPPLEDAGEGHRGIIEEVHSSSSEEGDIESVGAEDALEEVRERRKPVRRSYKIQEVIKRRQILLVQVVKEERGNKGAALTTYLSLAGRYSVLMPNTARGGGISRKITNAQDRKRLKDVVKDLEVPEGMGVILRTAGENRTKAEIKRDYEYLMRMWETVRNTTLKSTAPALVYEEGSLIKRSVRDLYNKDIDEIQVSGENGYREAKDFMRMLMPSHAKMVQPYRDATPIFARAGIDAQLDRMVQPQVTLKSGGYIIINQTEALVAIDVNSGRSTKEHSIEDTALQTNLEAAEEVARQLRLRDLAGLIVIDFIDMEENRNNRSVEKRLKDHLKNDRARIQVGRISHFGLMEMSRQRIRASVLESTMKPCPHCGGTGHIRSDSSVALLVVRAIEEFLLKDSRHHITVKTPAITALYVLNHKRTTLVEMERRFGLTITVEADETLGAQHYAIFRGAVAEKPADFVEASALLPAYDETDAAEDEEIVDIVEDEDEADETAAQPAQRGEQGQRTDGDGNRDRKRRRRRRRRGGRDRDNDGAPAEHDGDSISEASAEDDGEDGETDANESGDAVVEATAEGSSAVEHDRKKRRRGKRGGRRNRAEGANPEAGGEIVADGADADASAVADASGIDLDAAAEAAIESGAGGTEPVGEIANIEVVEAPVGVAPAEKPKRASRSRKKAATETSEEPVVAEAAPAKKVRAPRKRATKTEIAAEAAEAEIAVETAKAETIELGEVAATLDEPAVIEPQSSPQPVTEAQPTAEAEPEEPKVKKGGWWQRSKSFF